jgi:DNA-binding MarR family transcriptional regulator
VKRERPSRTLLSKLEAELWQAWRSATESVTSLVARDIATATGLSGADQDVLARLAELGRGKLRQQELADALGWHKSRLSHHLSRMEQRALVKRKQTAPNVVLVSTTPLGRQSLRAALPVQARAVRAHLVAQLSRAQRDQLFELLAIIAQAAFPHPAAASTAPAARPAQRSKKQSPVSRA